MKSTDFIVELLGCPADEMYEPVNADYICPFIEQKCIKRGHYTTDPFPVCSLWKYTGSGKMRIRERPVIVCPKRFFDTNVVDDILEHCWTTPYNRSNIRAVREISLGKAGNVDMVICDMTSLADNFISVELQAVDITGSVSSAYTAHMNREELLVPPKYNFNTANVFKRYITQLIKKGYVHSTWRKKVVAVVQDFLFEDMRRRVRFAATNPKDENTSIVFLSYALDTSARTEEGFYPLKLKEVVGTEHSALMSAVVYEQPPDKEKFLNAIRRQL
ncbi:MAG: hypothetical protein KGZ63_12825 [Clostridiales bacterium]|nr:hypothetical protein [Clostridiales bacterium]